MTHSMTGYARADIQHEGISLAWEIRSVNHRYLETFWRLPDDFRALEADLRSLAAKRLGRGKLDCALHIRGQLNSGDALEINAAQLAAVSAAADQIAASLKNPAPTNTLELLRWPGVVVESQTDLDPLRKVALTLFDEALGNLKKNRAVEGTRLNAMIVKRLDGLDEWVNKTRTRVPEIRELLADRLRTKLAEIAEQVKADEGRLEQELAIQMTNQAAKMDVDEELDRLGAHIDEVRSVLKRKEPIGRRLDFLMQELNREANTLGSKSVVTETTNISVELKVLIEQMREQVQNVE